MTQRIHYMFIICSLYIHYMFTICSLSIHYMFTIYSLFIIHQSMLYELLSNLIGSLLLCYDYDYYTDLPFMARSSCSCCMDLPFLVDSIALTMKIWIWLLKYTFIVATKPHLVQLLSICLKVPLQKKHKGDFKERKNYSNSLLVELRLECCRKQIQTFTVIWRWFRIYRKDTKLMLIALGNMFLVLFVVMKTIVRIQWYSR